MLKKGTEVIGHKVYTLNEGKLIGQIKDIVFDPGDHQVKALVLNDGGVFSSPHILLIEDIHSIGKDVITIQSRELLKQTKDVDKAISQIAGNEQYLNQTKIVTDAGTDLGQVSDILFDSKTGNVPEFEVTQGVFRNVQSGKKRIVVEDIITIGRDATIVKAETEDKIALQAQQQGLQGGFNQTKGQIPGAVNTVRTKAGELSATSQKKLEEFENRPQTQEFIKNVREKAQQAIAYTGKALKQATQKAEEKSVELKDQARNAIDNMGTASDNPNLESGEISSQEQIPTTTDWETVSTKTDYHKKVTSKPVSEKTVKQQVDTEVDDLVYKPTKSDQYRYAGAMGGKTQRKTKKNK